MFQMLLRCVCDGCLWGSNWNIEKLGFEEYVFVGNLGKEKLNSIIINT